MTVQELIKLLKKCNPSAEVIFSDMEQLNVFNIQLVESCLSSGQVHLYSEENFEVEEADYFSVKIVDRDDGFVSTRYYDADGEMTYFKFKEAYNDGNK